MKLYHLDRFGLIYDNKDITSIPRNKIDPSIRSSSFFDLFPQGVSNHCINMTSTSVPCLQHCTLLFGFINQDFLSVNSFLQQKNHINSQMIDFFFELVRQAKFPDAPSRFTSLFAVEKISDFSLWPELFRNLVPSTIRIIEIEVPDNTPRFDSSFLRGGIIFDKNQHGYFMGFMPTANYDFAINYWSGKTSDSPRFEYLIPLPLDGTKIRKVSLSEPDIQELLQRLNDAPFPRPVD